MRGSNYIGARVRPEPKPQEIKAIVPRKPRTRARVTNRPDELPNVDLRSLVARRFSDITSQIIIDLGGQEYVSEAKLQIIRRFAAASAMAEQLEAAYARGEQIDIAQHTTLASTVSRLASRIGLERRSKNITPDLDQYLASKANGRHRITIDAEDDDD